MLSIFCSILRKRGWPIFMRMARTPARNGMEIRKITARCGEIVKAMTVAISTMNGERISVRRNCCIVLRTVLTSVVARVIRLDVVK